MKQLVAVCNNISEVKAATNKLDKATLGPLRISDGGVWKDVKKWKGVYNVSQGEMAASVVQHYNLIQHKEYFDAFANALNRLDIKFEMTLKYSGHKAFADIDFKDRNVKFEKLNEEFTTGLRLANSYDKSYGLLVAPRFTRLACTNGMILTRSEKTLSIKHHTKIVKEVESFVEKKLSEIITEYSDLRAWVSGSMGESIEWITCCRILEKMFKQVIHREKILKNIGVSLIIVKDKKTKKKSINYVLDDEANKDKKISRWDLYNAVTKHLSHGEQITPFIEMLYHKYAQRILVTPFAKLPKVEAVLTV